jgi:hypothetical protein
VKAIRAARPKAAPPASPQTQDRAAHGIRAHRERAATDERGRTWTTGSTSPMVRELIVIGTPSAVRDREHCDDADDHPDGEHDHLGEPSAGGDVEAFDRVLGRADEGQPGQQHDDAGRHDERGRDGEQHEVALQPREPDRHGRRDGGADRLGEERREAGPAQRLCCRLAMAAEVRKVSATMSGPAPSRAAAAAPSTPEWLVRRSSAGRGGGWMTVEPDARTSGSTGFRGHEVSTRSRSRW